MLKNQMWNIFKKTGNIEAYLYLIKSDKLIEHTKDEFKKICNV